MPPSSSDIDIRQAGASSPKMSNCSNSSSNQMEEKRPPNADNERSAPGREISRNNPIPTPRSNNGPSDYSDVASEDSQRSISQRRRNKRGGRKKKEKAERQFKISRGQRQEQAAQAEPKWTDGNTDSENYYPEELQKASSPQPSSSKKKRSTSTTPKADTSIRAFDLKRGESSGGGRPVGVTVERPNSKSKANKKENEQRSENSCDENSEEGESLEEEKTEKTKSISIRFDLNLELEIFLRAKIKGDITMTFLE